MSYCSAIARIGSWKTGSAVTSAMRRPPRKTRGGCFLSDSTYSAPLRAGMAPTLSRNANPVNSRVDRARGGWQNQRSGGTRHGREYEENRAADDPVRPLRPDRKGQGRYGGRGHRELGDAGVVRPAAGGGGGQGRLPRARADQGVEGVRAQRARQGPAGDGLHVLQAGR